MASERRRGSVLVPVVAAMLILLLTGVALSELFGAQRMQSVLAIESAQAFWAAEAGLWHAAAEGTEVITPVDFSGSTYTVAKDGAKYTATATRGNATREAWFVFNSTVGGSGLASRPIAHWSMDETSGTLVADLIGAVNGTLNNGVVLGASGAPAGVTALSFDGSNDYVAIPHSSSFLLAEGTIQFWFNAADTSGTQGLFSKDSTGYDTGGHVHIDLYGDDLYARLQSTSTSYWLSVPNAITSGTWHHVALTFGAGGMRLYLNGAVRDVDSYTGGLGTTSGGAGNMEPLALGASSWASGDGVITPLESYFHGAIDEVAIYDVALSAVDVQALFDGGGDIQ